MSQTIVAALKLAAQQLVHVTDTPMLEAEILLTHVLEKPRAYLHTWPEQPLENSQHQFFSTLITRRISGEPIAYIIGHREFWTLDLIVSPDVLIPRPETELLVELVLEKVTAKHAIIADLGTGSGAIALAIAKERPMFQMHAVDSSAPALQIAQHNAQRLQIMNVTFHQGTWCDALPAVKFDAIVSNPPYIAEDDPHLYQGDLRFEPRGALVAAQAGLDDLTQIILQARNHLKSGGFLCLEHGFTQAKNVVSIFKKAGYTSTSTHRDLAGLDRVTIATWMYF